MTRAGAPPQVDSLSREFALTCTAEGVVTWLALGMDRAMEKHNRRRPADAE